MNTTEIIKRSFLDVLTILTRVTILPNLNYALVIVDIL